MRKYSSRGSADKLRYLAIEKLEPRLLLASTPLITEFMAVNDGTLLDENGNASDWIEIYNPSGQAVDLEGWYLTDNSNVLNKWQLPSITLPAGGYEVIFASGKNSYGTGPNAELHTNFELQSDAGYLALVEPDGTTIASEFANYPAQYAGISYGVEFTDFSTPSYSINVNDEYWLRDDGVVAYPDRDNDLVSVWSEAADPVVGARIGLLQFPTGALAGRTLHHAELEVYMTNTSSTGFPLKQEAFWIDTVGGSKIYTLDWDSYQSEYASSEIPFDLLGKYDVSGGTSGSYLTSSSSHTDLELLRDATLAYNEYLTFVFKALEDGNVYRGEWGDSENGLGARLNIWSGSYYKATTPGSVNNSGSAQPYYKPIPQAHQDTVGMWLFDESDGAAINTSALYWQTYDQSDQLNHGVRSPVGNSANAPQYSHDTPFAADFGPDGQNWNYSLDFATSNSARVDVVDSPSLDLTSDFTIETWVNFSNISGNQYLVSKRNTSGVESGYWLQWEGSLGNMYFQVGTSSGYQEVASVGFTPTVGQWHHVAGVHDSSAGQIRIYIDGVLSNTAPAQSTVRTNNDPLTMGNYNNFAPLKAKLDEVRISNRIVPANELGYHATYGPAKVVFGDNFESYNTNSDLNNPPSMWGMYSNGPHASVQLKTDGGYQSDNAYLLSHNNVTTYGNEAVNSGGPRAFSSRDEPIIANSGWIAIEGQESVRNPYIHSQIWTGAETHYGATQTLFAAAVEYTGSTQTWSHDPLQRQLDYASDVNVWHYFELTVDYEKKEYVSFQWDDEIWDLRGQPIFIGPNFFAPNSGSGLSFNMRLLDLPEGAPPLPYTAKYAFDNAAIRIIRRVLPTSTDLPYYDSFDTSDALSVWQAHSGTWSHDEISNSYYGSAVSGVEGITLLSINESIPESLNFDATINVSSTGLEDNPFLVFDYQSATDYKFAMLDISSDELRLGHRSGGIFIYDATTSLSLSAETDYQLRLKTIEKLAKVQIDGSPTLSFTFDDALTDGKLGLGASESTVRFDNISIDATPASIVTSFDLVTWQANYGTSSGANLASGDADGDGDVDGADFLAWQRFFSANNSSALAISGNSTESKSVMPTPSLQGLELEADILSLTKQFSTPSLILPLNWSPNSGSLGLATTEFIPTYGLFPTLVSDSGFTESEADLAHESFDLSCCRLIETESLEYSSFSISDIEADPSSIWESAIESLAEEYEWQDDFLSSRTK